MCVPSKPKLPPPPPTPAPPATEVNAAQARLRDQAPDAPQTAKGVPNTQARRRGKAALRIPLQQNILTETMGVNIP